MGPRGAQVWTRGPRSQSEATRWPRPGAAGESLSDEGRGSPWLLPNRGDARTSGTTWRTPKRVGRRGASAGKGPSAARRHGRGSGAAIRSAAARGPGPGRAQPRLISAEREGKRPPLRASRMMTPEKKGARPGTVSLAPPASPGDGFSSPPGPSLPVTGTQTSRRGPFPPARAPLSPRARAASPEPGLALR